MEKPYRRSIFWPLIFIAVGVLFLLNNFRIVQGDAWDLLVKLWPLLFLVGGVDSLFQGRGWVWGVFSICLGTVFLLANFDYLPWDAFDLLLRLWPVLLIAAGLDLVFRGRSPLVNIAGILVALLLVGGIVWYSFSNVSVISGAAEPVSQSLGNAKKANLVIENPFGDLKLSSGAADGQLIEGTAMLIKPLELEQRYNVANTIGTFNLRAEGEVIVPFGSNLNRPTWDLKVNDDVPLNIQANSAFGRQTIDFTGLNVERFDLEVAFGLVTVTLPDDVALNGQIDLPFGSVVVYVPKDAHVQVNADTAFTALTYPDGFERSGNVISSQSTDGPLMRITINQPFGRVSIRYLP